MTAAVDPLPILTKYLRALESARFDEAVACFTEDAYYLHAPFAFEPPGSPDHVARGRAEMLRLFALRGVLARLHHIQACVVTGKHAFMSGLTTNLLAPEDTTAGYFVAEAILSDEGLIRWFAGFGRTAPGGAAFSDVHPIPPLRERIPPAWAVVPSGETTAHST